MSMPFELSADDVVCPYCGHPHRVRVVADTRIPDECNVSFFCPRCILAYDTPRRAYILTRPAGSDDVPLSQRILQEFMKVRFCIPPKVNPWDFDPESIVPPQGNLTFKEFDKVVAIVLKTLNKSLPTKIVWNELPQLKPLNGKRVLIEPRP